MNPLALFGMLSPRAWLTIGASIVVAIAIGWAVAWVHGKDLAIRTAQTQRSAAVLALVRDQGDLIVARVNEAALAAAMHRQSAMVNAQSARDAAALQRAARDVQAAQRAHAADQARLAALGRPLVAATPCLRADEAAARAREALR